MNKYNDLEISILSCLLQKPDLMKINKLEDIHFIKHKRLWLFIKECYKKFGTFDIDLMYSVVENKYQFIEYMSWLLDVEPAPSLFEIYQQQLIDLYNESKKDKYIIEETYKLANELYVRNITTDDFKHKIVAIYKNADEIFKKDGDK